jgi:acetyltransferase-like isoleucine patch superfamily enzyme
MQRAIALLILRLHRLAPYLAKIRYRLLCHGFERHGKGGSIGRQFRVMGKLSIAVGDRVAFRDNIYLGGNGRLTVGSHTSINAGCMIAAMESVQIGSNVMFAPYVYVLDVDHKFERLDIPMTKQGYTISPVVIEDDVWIGTGAVITKGVRIGRGSIIGANSVVTRDVPPYSLAAGAPAKVIRQRAA